MGEGLDANENNGRQSFFNLFQFLLNKAVAEVKKNKIIKQIA